MSAAEIAELRRRLSEAEETLRAIREGEVDALVVGAADREQIFTIEGESESYRAFMEVMGIGAVALDQARRVLYVNSALARALDLKASAVQGRRFADLVDADLAAAIDAVLDPAPGSADSAEVRLRGPEGDRHFLVAARPLRLGTVRGHAVTFTDMTDRVEAEIALQSERAARAVIASANEAVLVCDLNGIVSHANAAARGATRVEPVGHAFAEVIPLQFRRNAGFEGAADLGAGALGGASSLGLEAVAPAAPIVKDYLISAAPLQVSDDEIGGCVVTMVDLSQRKAAEKQQTLLMQELDHRVRNTLALVLSISSRTMHNEDTLEGFQKSFTSRIQALAATHGLLAERSWADVSVVDIVSTELAPYLQDGAGRVSTEDLSIHVAPRAAIALGLVFHELTTNAVKYGALSSSGGRVLVRRLEGAPGSTLVEWREEGGPAVAPPSRRGFGESGIARTQQKTPRGGTEIEFAPSGVVCRISIPTEDVRPAA